MRRKFTDGFLDHAEQIISQGSTLKEAAALLGCADSNLSKALRTRNPLFDTEMNRGARCPNRNDGLPETDIAARYGAGESEKAIASCFGVSRVVIARILDKHGVTRRGRSTANFVRMSRMSPGGRKANASAAHAKVRSLPPERFRLSSIKRARTVESGGLINVGPGEKPLLDAMIAAGLRPIWQKAVDHYSVDIAFGSVAVEVRWGHSGRMRTFRARGRFEHLSKCGYKLVTVQILDAEALRNLDDIVALLQIIDRKPAAPGKYWVVRSGLQSNPLTRLNGNHRAAVKAPPELVTSIRECNAG